MILISVAASIILTITLPIMAEINQSPHDQLTDVLADITHTFNFTSDEYNDVQTSTVIPDLGSREQNIDPIDVYNGSFPWDANNEFALKMYKNIVEKNPDKNIFFSPTSIMIAMAMAYEGAGGNTAREMSDILHILPDDDTRRNNILSAIKSVNKQDSMGDMTNVVNSLWIKDGFTVHDEYADILSKYYNSTVGTFHTGQSGYDKINDWVSDATRKSIQKVVNPPDLSGAKTVLVNTVYFDHDWPFVIELYHTQKADFWITPKKSTDVYMMHFIDDFPYTHTDGIKMINLRYYDHRYSMLLVLPDDPENMNFIENSLSTSKLSTWLNNATFITVRVNMPKFIMDTKYDIKTILQDLGINDAFEEYANFSKMSEQSTHISNIKHITFVEVDEVGTKAAAATYYTSVVGGGMQSSAKFNADRPFIFVIWDHETKSILFMGKMADPTGLSLCGQFQKDLGFCE